MCQGEPSHHLCERPRSGRSRDRDHRHPRRRRRAAPALLRRVEHHQRGRARRVELGDDLGAELRLLGHHRDPAKVAPRPFEVVQGVAPLDELVQPLTGQDDGVAQQSFLEQATHAHHVTHVSTPRRTGSRRRLIDSSVYSSRDSPVRKVCASYPERAPKLGHPSTCSGRPGKEACPTPQPSTLPSSGAQPHAQNTSHHPGRRAAGAGRGTCGRPRIRRRDDLRGGRERTGHRPAPLPGRPADRSRHRHREGLHRRRARACHAQVQRGAERARPAGQRGVRACAELPGKFAIFVGGFPIEHEGQIVGAVGVSGGNGEQDKAVGAAALAAFAQHIEESAAVIHHQPPPPAMRAGLVRVRVRPGCR